MLSHRLEVFPYKSLQCAAKKLRRETPTNQVTSISVIKTAEAAVKKGLESMQKTYVKSVQKRLSQNWLSLNFLLQQFLSR